MYVNSKRRKCFFPVFSLIDNSVRWKKNCNGYSAVIFRGIKLSCSDRILTCRTESICSPAKVGLVVIDLITSPVVSWRGVGGGPPPPPHTHTAAQLSFFAQPRLS